MVSCFMTVSAIVSPTITATPPPCARGTCFIAYPDSTKSFTAICDGLNVSVNVHMSNLFSVMWSWICWYLSSSHAEQVLRTATLSKFVV